MNRDDLPLKETELYVKSESSLGKNLGLRPPKPPKPPKVSEEISEKIRDFRVQLLQTLLTAASLLVDCIFWIGWAFITNQTNTLVSNLGPDEPIDKLPFVVAQWCGCGTLMIFVIYRTLSDVISMTKNFWKFCKEAFQR